MLRVTLISCFLLTHFAQAVSNIENKQYRSHSMRTFTLDNDLQVLVISDPNATKSAAAISVNVGHRENPKDHPGLAHFVEHMLFIGTKKFPVAGDYKAHIKKNGGYSNAYTSRDETNYYFEIATEFDGALDRFSQFFISPLFDKNFVEKEKNAIQNEFSRNTGSDSRQFWEISSEIAPQGSPDKKFSTGNLESLKNTTELDTRAFFNKYYYAKNMRLVLTGNQSLDELQLLANTYFSPIPSGHQRYERTKKFYHSVTPRDIQIKSLENNRWLYLLFEVPKYAGDEFDGINRILRFIFGYKGEGSLASELINQGLVTSFHGTQSSVFNGRRFGAKAILTEKGQKNVDKITEMFFSYLKSIKEIGYKKYLFEEYSSWDKISYKYKTLMKHSDLAESYASLMQRYHPFKNEALSIIQNYSPKNFDLVLSYLTPENLDRFLLAPGVTTDRIGKGYKFHYSVNPIDKSTIGELKAVTTSTFRYPPKNKFALTPDMLETPFPTSAKNLTKMKLGMMGELWVQNDERIKSPKAAVKILIRSDAFGKSYDAIAVAKLYDYAINESLREWLFPIRDSGISVTIDSVQAGLKIKISGYAPHIPKLIELLGKKLKNVKIGSDKIENIKQEIKQVYLRRNYEKPRNTANRRFSNMIYPDSVHHHNFADLIEELTLEDVNKFTRTAFSKVKVFAAMTGAIDKKVFSKSVKSLLFNLGARPDFFIKLAKPFDLPKGRYAFQEDTNSRMSFWSTRYYSPVKSNLTAAAVRVFSQLYSGSFYTELRTRQQLAYSLRLSASNYAKAPRLNFYVESSTHSPLELENRAMLWLAETLKELESLDAKSFNKAKTQLIKSALMPPDDNADASSALFNLLTEYQGDDRFVEKYILGLKALSLKEFKGYIGSIFSDGTQITGFIDRKGDAATKIPEKYEAVHPEDFRQRMLNKNIDDDEGKGKDR